jgi:hypothetical protein
MNKDAIIQKTKKHIQEIRQNSPSLSEREIKIALGKVILDIKDAKKYDNNILKKLFIL